MNDITLYWIYQYKNININCSFMIFAFVVDIVLAQIRNLTLSSKKDWLISLFYFIFASTLQINVILAGY